MNPWEEADRLKRELATKEPGRKQGPLVVSADRRRTLMAEQRIANGRHPIGVPLLSRNGFTCGDCANLRVKEFVGRYFKCAKAKDTNGPATDIRKKWPACQWFMSGGAE